MLRELHIRNLAVIEDAAIELTDGLNCFTGQTGSGKSLLIGAFEILLGLRGASDMLRAGCEQGKVTGLFEVGDAETARQIGAACDQPIEAGEGLLITRKLFASGRTSVSINGEPATAPMVRRIGQMLVDIHGQHDHQRLLKPSEQLDILDRYAGTTDLRAEFAKLYQQRRDLRDRAEQLASSDELRRQQLELLQFQAREIDEVDPVGGEYEQLETDFRRLSHGARVQADASKAHQALYEGDGSAVERLQAITEVLMELSELDDRLAETTEQVRQATLTLQESSYDLNRLIGRLETDPTRLEELEHRLNQLNRLISKYIDARAVEDPGEALVEFRAEIGQQIEDLKSDDMDLEKVEARCKELDRELEELGRELSDQRQAAAKKLAPDVVALVHELGMEKAEFEIAFEAQDLAEAGPAGLDQVEMMVRTNPGQPARPLRKIASGGEMSRLMLALKSILADADSVNVLVFDEIDAQIGGRMGTVIGSRLRALAEGGHQVLCITHLPQIAAWADRHLRITKRIETTEDSETAQASTVVHALEDDDRLDELAEMLAGDEASQTTREQAKELIAQARKHPAKATAA